MTDSNDSLLFINGELKPARSGKRYPNICPSNGQVVGHAADAAVEDMEDAIAGARVAFDQSKWATDRDLRIHALTQLKELLVAARPRLKQIALDEVGAPGGCIYGPHCDAPLSFLDYPIETLKNYKFERELPVVNTMGTPSKRLVWKEAAGVVGAITPWNVPLQINLAKIFPALAAGCTVVLKPAPETPWSATVLGELVQKTDIPRGVFNVVTSAEPVTVGEKLVTDPRVDMISFTGSTATGRRIMAAGAPTIKKLFLELGGKSAFIVLDDANFEQVIPTSAFFVLYHAGQGCACFTRLLVPRKRYEESIRMLKAAFEAMPYTDPKSDQQIMGPLISERQRERVLSYIKIGQEEGARLVTGGGIPADAPKGGFYVQPTLFADVNNSMRIAQEEIFGPVLCVIPHDGDDDAVRIANDSIFGLSGGVASASHERALSIARRIRTGTYAVNGANYFAADTPFGGYKQSGIGREMGIEGFEEYLQTKSVAVPA
ncbi:MAG TPA: aldehyde dehydrogenase family protein [Alphaproteobacteria bacterium]|nr:aldehyde dehydrogenase family protein [Alphaproteobacteria bacterium]